MRRGAPAVAARVAGDAVTFDADAGAFRGRAVAPAGRGEFGADRAGVPLRWSSRAVRVPRPTSTTPGCSSKPAGWSSGAGAAPFLNDADAAGIAEMPLRCRPRGRWRGVRADARHGNRLGAVRRWAPAAEHRARAPRGRGARRARGGSLGLGAGVRSELGLDWPAWVARLDQVLAEIHRLFWPDIHPRRRGQRALRRGSLLRAPVEVRPAALGLPPGRSARRSQHERYNP